MELLVKLVVFGILFHNLPIIKCQYHETIDHDDDIFFYWSRADFRNLWFNHYENFATMDEESKAYFPSDWSFDSFNLENTTNGVWVVFHEITNGLDVLRPFISKRTSIQFYDYLEVRCFFSDPDSFINVSTPTINFTFHRQSDTVGWETFLFRELGGINAVSTQYSWNLTKKERKHISIH